MDPAEFFSASRVLIVAGKGGVGKTVVTAALARAAARSGLDTLVVELEGRSALASSFGVDRLGYRDAELLTADPRRGRGRIRGRTITPDEALVEYLEDHGLRRIARRMAATGLVEVIATATPGIKDLLVLGKVKQLEQQRAADLIVVDAHAAGHAVTFLDSPRALLDTAKVGPIGQQAADALALLRDPARCQVLLVTLPEETPINELVETAYRLEDRIGVPLGPVVVNGVYPELHGLDIDPTARLAAAGVPGATVEALRAAGALRERRRRLQAEQVRRLAELLPLPQLHLPHVFGAQIGPVESEQLGDALLDGVARLG